MINSLFPAPVPASLQEEPVGHLERDDLRLGSSGHSNAVAPGLWRRCHRDPKESKGEGGGWLLINFGWGLAVFMGVYVAFQSGAHLNPAVTLALTITGDITFSQSLVYYAAELIGAFIGAVLAWLAFKQHFDAEEDPGESSACSPPARPSAITAGTP